MTARIGGKSAWFVTSNIEPSFCRPPYSSPSHWLDRVYFCSFAGLADTARGPLARDS